MRQCICENRQKQLTLNSQWVEINADEIRAAADFWRNRQHLSLRELVQIWLGADRRAQDDNVSLAADDWLRDPLERLQQKRRIEQMDAPRDSAGQLLVVSLFCYSGAAVGEAELCRLRPSAEASARVSCDVQTLPA